jgi:hypothetical protein
MNAHYIMNAQNHSNHQGLPREAVRIHLTSAAKLPGRIILVSNGYEEYGQTLIGLGSYAHPLIFETGLDGAEYGIAGSCFLINYRGEHFVLTAKHCLTGSNGNEVRIALNPKTKSFLPLKQLHKAESNPPNQNYADVAIFEAAPELLQAEEQDFLEALQLDDLKLAEFQLKQDTKLVVPGFPKALNEVDYDRYVLHTQRYLPSAEYDGAADRPGIHRMQFDDLSHIDWPDGMSGSPVFFIEDHPDGHYFGFAGMLIRAHQTWRHAEFIGANVLFFMLDTIIAQRSEDGQPPT